MKRDDTKKNFTPLSGNDLQTIRLHYPSFSFIIAIVLISKLFNLMRYIPVLNAYFCFFCSENRNFFRKKYQKHGQLCPAFGASFAHKLHQHSLLQYCSVGAHLVGRSLSQCLGWQELASLKHHAPVSKHCSAAHCASQRCPPASGGELPFVRYFRTLCATLLRH